jgi:MinD-like ATPase involved in chromosome partitioning or flagellar assembly
MNATEFLKKAKRLGDVHAVFRFPYVHVFVISQSFTGLEDEDRELDFSAQLKTSIAELRKTLQNSLLMLRLVTPDEYKSEQSSNGRTRGHHWLSAFVDQVVGDKQTGVTRRSPIRTVHFYGYKGGQARSTLLGLMAVALAKDGWKVLAIDSDIEAPSLDVLFGRSSRSVSGTLLGVIQGPSKPEPDRVVTPSESGGYVDLLSCRPRSSEFDIDAAALALRSALEPKIVEDAAGYIASFAVGAEYDIVLVDHRAGLSTSTLPWVNSLPGPIVVLVRLDEQWRPAQRFIKTLFQSYLPNPGLFVSWKPDEELLETYRQRNAAQIDMLLDTLADAVSAAGEEPGSVEAELSSVELEDHWIVWPYDSAFRSVRLPDTSQLAPPTLDAIARVRSLLDLGTKKEVARVLLSPSGAEDEGDLIQTEALRQLTAPANAIGYVFGRKGTGKTRLVTELARLNLGEPLLVDSADKSGLGLKSPSSELLSAAERFGANPDRLWWHLLAAAVAVPRTDTNALAQSFQRELGEHGDEDPNQIVSRIQLGAKRTFLLDGLETAFSGKIIFAYVESLFRFLRICESDSRISASIQCKLFLRSDLAERGYQNLEQQLFGRWIYLIWDTQAILNFVLSRLGRYPWYEAAFPALITEIRGRRSEILNGTVPVEECEALLLMAFPATLRRNNLATKTFLKTYFADSASDASGRLRYYPRIFDKFLSVIADPGSTGERSFVGSQLEEDKISQRLIFLAHDAAANEYLNQLQSELRFLINFSDDISENQQKIGTLLGAFSGLPTPFVFDECVLQIDRKVGLGEPNIRSAMEKMKSVGIFEDRPDYPGQWRVGRLFKSSLRMKYVRGPKREDQSLFDLQE